MTSERSGAALRAAQRSRFSRAGALLAAASLAALAGCSVREEAANAQLEASGSVVAALDDSWPEFCDTPALSPCRGPARRWSRARLRWRYGRCTGQDGTLVYPPTCELLEVHGQHADVDRLSPPRSGTEPATRAEVNATLTRYRRVAS